MFMLSDAPSLLVFVALSFSLEGHCLEAVRGWSQALVDIRSKAHAVNRNCCWLLPARNVDHFAVEPPGYVWT